MPAPESGRAEVLPSHRGGPGKIAAAEDGGNPAGEGGEEREIAVLANAPPVPEKGERDLKRFGDPYGFCG